MSYFENCKISFCTVSLFKLCDLHPEIIDDILVSPGKPELKDLLIKPNRERKSLKLVGFKKKDNVKVAQKAIEDHMEALARAARRRKETRKVKSSEHITILNCQGSLAAICSKFADLVIDASGNEVTVEGDPADIPNAFIEMYAECEKIEPIVFKHERSREWVQFIRRESTKEHLMEKLKKRSLKGCFTVNGTDVSVYVPNGCNGETINELIAKTVVEETIKAEPSSKDLLKSDIWTNFLSDFKKNNNEETDVTIKQNQTVLVVGLEEAVPRVVKQIKGFLDVTVKKTISLQCEPLEMDFVFTCWKDEDLQDIESHGVVLKKNGSFSDYCSVL